MEFEAAHIPVARFRLVGNKDGHRSSLIEFDTGRPWAPRRPMHQVLATHGRAIWILDHLEPIQEYAAAQAAATDAKLFTPPPSVMYRRHDRHLRFLKATTGSAVNAI